MALSSLHPCNSPGCRALVRGQARCEKHTAENAAAKAKRDDGGRPNFRDRGYPTEWDKLRRQVIDAHPICQVCGARPSKLVHHSNEVKTHPHLVLAESHLVATCSSCHQRLHSAKRAKT